MTIVARQSEVKRYKRCPRSEWLGYRRGGLGLKLQDQPVGIRDLGTLVHEGIAAYYTQGSSRGPVALALAANVGEAFNPAVQDVAEYAAIMLEGYEQWVAETGADVGEETVAVELRLEARAGFFYNEEVFVTGKLDRLVRDTITGELILEDTKTVQTLTPPPLEVDDQLLTYCWLAEQAGYGKVTRVRHNMLRKVKRGPRATPPFYGRVEVPVNDAQRESHLLHMSATLDALALSIVRRDRGESHHITNPPNPTRDCSWDCDFLAVCPMLDDGSDWEGVLDAMYEPRTEEDNV